MKIMLATGRKAAEMVKDAVKATNVPDITCAVLTQDLNIAAFTTPRSLRKALEKDEETARQETHTHDLILVSGFCTADFSALEQELRTPIRLGPRHAYDLGEALQSVSPREFSPRTPADLFLEARRRENAMQQLEALERRATEIFSLKDVKIGGGARMKVCAELVDATLMTEQQILRLTAHYLGSGADILDIGVHIGATPEEVRSAVRTVSGFAANVPLSIDTLDPALIQSGIEAGVDMVLSLNKGNIPEVGEALADHDTAAVIIPDAEGGLESLEANLRMAAEHGITRLIADPILNAIGYGIAESLDNYYQFRLKDPRTPLFFGVGNVTELTDADSVGINATLAGIASELDAAMLFTPECSDKAHGSVHELRVAAEMMLLATARRSAPKDLGIDLLVLKEKRRKPIARLPEGERVIAEKAATWQLDPKGFFRIGIYEFEENGTWEQVICAEHSPSGRLLIGTSAQAIMDTILRLDLVSLPGHVAYLSRELAKAELALKLERSYEQDEELV
jgi:dihydropteroate synthase-like protein